jgi:hypothetical protein
MGEPALGDRSAVEPAWVDELRAALRGQLIEAGDAAYDTRQGRAVWNADIDTPR